MPDILTVHDDLYRTIPSSIRLKLDLYGKICRHLRRHFQDTAVVPTSDRVSIMAAKDHTLKFTWWNRESEWKIQCLFPKFSAKGHTFSEFVLAIDEFEELEIPVGPHPPPVGHKEWHRFEGNGYNWWFSHNSLDFSLPYIWPSIEDIRTRRFVPTDSVVQVSLTVKSKKKRKEKREPKKAKGYQPPAKYETRSNWSPRNARHGI
jgi:hypothetical protein